MLRSRTIYCPKDQSVALGMGGRAAETQWCISASATAGARRRGVFPAAISSGFFLRSTFVSPPMAVSRVENIAQGA